MSKLVADINKRGKFIVIYAPNNLGKTSQMRMLTQKMIENKNNFLAIKYPIYNLKPTGSKINAVLRKGTKMHELEFQLLYAKNRKDFQDQLIDLLNCGINIVAEDYKGTGMAWGITNGLTLTKIEKINRGLVEPDLAILLDGKRFSVAKENGHRHEDSGYNVWKTNRKIHRMLAKKYGWKIINGNKPVEVVAKNVWKQVSMLKLGS